MIQQLTKIQQYLGNHFWIILIEVVMFVLIYLAVQASHDPHSSVPKSMIIESHEEPFYMGGQLWQCFSAAYMRDRLEVIRQNKIRMSTNPE